MSEWMRSFVGYLLLAGLATQMLPGKKYEQYVRLFLGFLLIVLVLQPILKIGSANVLLQEKLNGLLQEQELIEEQIFAQSEIFKQESEALQKESLEEMKVQKIEKIQVEVTADD